MKAACRRGAGLGSSRDPDTPALRVEFHSARRA
jgi:hypothetical protein